HAGRQGTRRSRPRADHRRGRCGHGRGSRTAAHDLRGAALSHAAAGRGGGLGAGRAAAAARGAIVVWMLRCGRASALGGALSRPRHLTRGVRRPNDSVIVGAGSAGCVLANRLSADRGKRVLLLEAGPRDWHPFIHMPAGLAKLIGRKGINWDYYTEPEPNL